jgi:hypothetical protein
VKLLIEMIRPFAEFSTACTFEVIQTFAESGNLPSLCIELHEFCEKVCAVREIRYLHFSE